MKIVYLAPLLALIVYACGKPEKGDKGDPGAPGIRGERGPAGENGTDGPEIDVIDPCPTIASDYPEVVWRMNDLIYGVYAQGQKIHLVLLTPGNYKTTDGRNCYFQVNPDGTVKQLLTK